MNEKRFSSNFYEEEGRTITDNGNEITQNEVVDLLNELNDENKTLKAQLYCEGGVCNICKHQQLTPAKVMQGYYTAKCEKGHKDCSKEDLKHCKDFKLKELEDEANVR